MTLVTPEDPTVLLTVVIESLLALLKYDVINSSSDHLKDLKPGQSVGLIQERTMFPGIYEGVVSINGNDFYRVSRSDVSTMTENIPIGRGREWRIQPYSAAESVKQKRKTTVYGKDLEALLDLPAGGLKAFQKSKLLVVAPDKSRLLDAIRDVRIGEDPLEAIFPIADYQSVGDWRYVGSFGLNNLKQEPIIGLVANCDMAVDIALKDPNFKLLVLDGASKLRAHYGSIERFNADINPRKTLCILKPTDEDEIETLKAMGIESFVWKRNDFSDIKLNFNQDSDNKIPFVRHKKILDNLAGTEPEYQVLNLPPAIDTVIEEAFKTLYSLSRNIQTNLPETGIIIRWGISILNGWLQLPFTINKYHQIIEQENLSQIPRLDSKFDEFKLRLRTSYGLYIPSTFQPECDELISKLDIIFHYFTENSPKEEALKSLVFEDNRNTNVYCCRSNYTTAFNSTFKRDSLQAKNIEQLSIAPVDMAIVTGWSSRRNTAHSFLAPAKNITFLLYRKEMESTKNAYKTHPASPSSDFDSDFRVKLGLRPDNVASESDTSNDAPNSVESLLEYVSHKFDSPVFPGFDAERANSAEEVEAYEVTFEDGSVAYASSEFTFDKISRERKKMLRVNLSDITLGDELVFADSERGLFEELLSILQESEEYKQLSKIASIWHTTLQEFVDANGLDDKQLASMFSMVGCPRTTQAIRSWLDGRVIGPSYQNYAAITAIGKITQNQNLLTRKDEVIRACKTLHALHVKTGWLLVRNIVNAAIEPDDEEINIETKERLQKYAGSAKLKVVKSISERTFSVPVIELGKLHEAYL